MREKSPVPKGCGPKARLRCCSACPYRHIGGASRLASASFWPATHHARIIEMGSNKNEEANKKIRILLVDDHAVVRAGYSTLLRDAPNLEVIAEADTGHAALREFIDKNPDLVI